MARIVFNDRNGHQQSVDIGPHNPEVSVGRLENLSVVTSDPSVSRRHCVIRFGQGGDVVIEDLQSTHGTLVNGSPIRTQRLTGGDEIRCGHFVLRYVDDPEPRTFADTPPSGPIPAVLNWSDDQGSNQAIRLDEQRPFATVGRLNDCEIRTNDSATSRRHARIKWVDGAYDVVDLRSVNGTQVNGRDVQRATLQPGDTVICGNLRIQFTLASGRQTPIGDDFSVPPSNSFSTNPPAHDTHGRGMPAHQPTIPPPPHGHGSQQPPSRSGRHSSASASAMPTDPVATLPPGPPPQQPTEDKPLEVRRLEAEIEVLRAQVARGGFAGSDSQAQRELDHARSAMQHAQDELERVKADLDREKERGRILVDEYKTRFERLQSDFDAQARELEQLRAGGGGGGGGDASLQARVTDLEEELEFQQEAIDAKDAKIMRLRDQLDSLSDGPNPGGALDATEIRHAAGNVVEIFDAIQSEIARVNAAAKRVDDDPLSPGYVSGGPSLEDVLPRSVREIRELIADGRAQANNLKDMTRGEE